MKFTEEPIRQGRVENPWEGMVGGVVLGEAGEAGELIRKLAADPSKMRRALAMAERQQRMDWGDIVATAESVLGTSWKEMCGRHGDWGRDGVVAVAARHLGWRLVELVGKVPGVNYASLDQGQRRFWRKVADRAEMGKFVARMLAKCKK